MSGVTPQQVADFRRALRGQGVTFAQLAFVADLGRTHVSQVLNARRSGGRSWAKIREAVWKLAPSTIPQLDQLEQFATWNAPAGLRPWLARSEDARRSCA